MFCINESNGIRCRGSFFLVHSSQYHCWRVYFYLDFGYLAIQHARNEKHARILLIGIVMPSVQFYFCNGQHRKRYQTVYRQCAEALSSFDCSKIRQCIHLKKLHCIIELSTTPCMRTHRHNVSHRWQTLELMSNGLFANDNHFFAHF